jgi:xylitol oxidase
MAVYQNWAKNLTYQAARWHTPTSIDELRAIVRSSQKVRVVGSRHSFNQIADTPHDLISMEHFNKVIAIDPEQRTVTVEAGIRYGDLGRQLQAAGFALHNLASLPHISVAGACATATHGSGDRNGNLATAVTAIEFMTATGDLVNISQRDGEHFNGVVVNLGAFGIVTKMTLTIMPSFQVRQDLYEHLPMAHLESHFDTIMSSAYSVSLFTDWRTERINQIWLKHVVTPGEQVSRPPTWFDAVAAPERIHPIRAIASDSCTDQLGVPGPWHERLPHFKLEFTPSSGEELQTEYFVPRSQAVAAIKAMYALREYVSPLLMISEVRSIAADTLWMSPNYQQDSIALHFTWQQRWPAVREVLPRLETALAPYGAKPHWGKLFTMAPAQVQQGYARISDFRSLLNTYDPQGMFRNDFVESVIFGS